MNAPSTNPFNDRPTIRLLDQAGVELARISQRDAARLLRAGQADLVFEVPPTVRLVVETPEYECFRDTPPDDATLKAVFLHARRGVLYGNVHFTNPSGEMMFHGDQEKALWYLNRGLVEVVSTSPPVLRFLFAPGGPGHAGDDYYLTGKANRCVVCGSEDGLNRHHVVPSVYRRHLPSEVKDHSHHDVLLLCLDCHERYESEANALKAILGDEHGVPLHGLKGEADQGRNRAIKAAHALVRHGDKIPAARRVELMVDIAEWAGRVPEEDELAVIAGLDSANGERLEHGEHVVANTADVQGFIRRWREHFLKTMKPAYLPEHWDVDRPATRGDRGEE